MLMNHKTMIDLANMAFRLANRTVVAEIESEAVRVKEDGITYWDIRPMLDPQRLSAEEVALNTEALRFAALSELVSMHPEHQHLYKINRVQ